MPHPLADAIIQACLDCEARIPGYAEQVIERIAQVGGREKHQPDWEQLLQYLAELHVLRQVLAWPWLEGTRFEAEPRTTKNGKNPELIVRTGDFNLGLEVKAPSLFQHQRARSINHTQIASRFASKDLLSSLIPDTSEITWPRDNPVKDFLVSAEAKFSDFTADAGFVGILVIVWDDFIYEPLSALAHPSCGLLTENSFAKDASGQPLRFPSVSGVVVIRHLHQLVRACRDESLIDGLIAPFDYGEPGRFPWKAFIDNPAGPAVPDQVLDLLQARKTTYAMGAEYSLRQEYIMWL